MLCVIYVRVYSYYTNASSLLHLHAYIATYRHAKINHLVMEKLPI